MPAPETDFGNTFVLEQAVMLAELHIWRELDKAEVSLKDVIAAAGALIKFFQMRKVAGLYDASAGEMGAHDPDMEDFFKVPPKGGKYMLAERFRRVLHKIGKVEARGEDASHYKDLLRQMGFYSCSEAGEPGSGGFEDSDAPAAPMWHGLPRDDDDEDDNDASDSED